MAEGRGDWRAAWQGAALAMAALAPAAAAQPRVMVDGKMVRGADTYVIGGNLMVPVRGVVQRIRGARASWVPARQEIIVSRSGQQMRPHLGSGYGQLRGQAIPLGAPVAMRDGRALMPLRAVTEWLGATVRYQSKRRLASIRSPRPGARVLGYRDMPGAAAPKVATGSVAVGGVQVLDLRTSGEYSSIEERAAAVTDRLTDAMADLGNRRGSRGSRAWIAESAAGPVILIGNKPIVRVAPEDAKQRHTTQQALAGQWLRQIRAGLTRMYGTR